VTPSGSPPRRRTATVRAAAAPAARAAARSTAGKLASLATLARRVARLRRRRPRPRIVLANGLFDLLHVGHLRYLEGAKRCGDCLVVAVNDDRSARRLRGPGRPIVPARDRARLVAALRAVDAVVLFGGRSVARVLRTLRPDVHCKGTDYSADSVPERDVVRGYGGRTRIVGDPKRHATTSLLARIAGRAAIAMTRTRS
jgi:rfaE bifunctional protein nucleotidyltransferase chain/domain